MQWKLGRILAPAMLASIAVAGPAMAAGDPVTMVPDAREEVPAGLIGIWEVDRERSESTRSGTQLRSFQYGADATLMVNFLIVNDEGRQLFGHWAAKLDGSPTVEYRSDNGSTPIAVLRFRKIDEMTFHLENYVGGILQSRAEYYLSEDGESLTLKRIPLEGASRTMVYKKWAG